MPASARDLLAGVWNKALSRLKRLTASLQTGAKVHELLTLETFAEAIGKRFTLKIA